MNDRFHCNWMSNCSMTAINYSFVLHELTSDMDFLAICDVNDVFKNIERVVSGVLNVDRFYCLMMVILGC